MKTVLGSMFGQNNLVIPGASFKKYQRMGERPSSPGGTNLFYIKKEHRQRGERPSSFVDHDRSTTWNEHETSRESSSSSSSEEGTPSATRRQHEPMRQCLWSFREIDLSTTWKENVPKRESPSTKTRQHRRRGESPSSSSSEDNEACASLKAPKKRGGKVRCQSPAEIIADDSYDLEIQRSSYPGEIALPKFEESQQTNEQPPSGRLWDEWDGRYRRKRKIIIHWGTKEQRMEKERLRLEKEERERPEKEKIEREKWEERERKRMEKIKKERQKKQEKETQKMERAATEREKWEEKEKQTMKEIRERRQKEEEKERQKAKKKERERQKKEEEKRRMRVIMEREREEKERRDTERRIRESQEREEKEYQEMQRRKQREFMNMGLLPRIHLWWVNTQKNLVAKAIRRNVAREQNLQQDGNHSQREIQTLLNKRRELDTLKQQLEDKVKEIDEEEGLKILRRLKKMEMKMENVPVVVPKPKIDHHRLRAHIQLAPPALYDEV